MYVGLLKHDAHGCTEIQKSKKDKQMSRPINTADNKMIPVGYSIMVKSEWASQNEDFVQTDIAYKQ